MLEGVVIRNTVLSLINAPPLFNAPEDIFGIKKYDHLKIKSHLKIFTFCPLLEDGRVNEAKITKVTIIYL